MREAWFVLAWPRPRSLEVQAQRVLSVHAILLQPECGKSRTKEDREAFDRAWLAHIHRNAHHWQHHLLHEDEGRTKVMAMPYQYRVEMVCDWIGAGRAQGHGNDVLPWYMKHRKKMKLHETTRRLVEQELGN